MGIVKKAIHSGGTVTVDSLIEASQFRPKILQEFYASPYVFARAPLTAFLSGLTGVSPQEDTTDSRMIKWLIYGMSEKPLFIRGARGSFRVGVNEYNEIDIADGLIFENGVLRLENWNYQLFVKRVIRSTKDISTLQVTVMGNNPNTVVPSKYLENNRTVKYQASIHQEGSPKGTPERWSSGDERVNGSTIVRTDKEMTGSARVQGLVMETMIPGFETPYTSYIADVVDGNRSTLGVHLARCEEQGLYGINNVNYGNAASGGGSVYNTASDGRVVQSGDGILQQWEQGFTLPFSLRDSPEQIRQKMFTVMRLVRQVQDADTIDMNVTGGDGAEMVFTTVMADWLQDHNTMIMVDGNGDRTPMAGVTDVVKTFKTPAGTINFIYTKAFNDRSESGEMLSYNGQVMSADSFDMRFFVRKQNSDGKMNIRKFNLEKNQNGTVIQRGLVSAWLPGMTGALGGMTNVTSAARTGAAANVANAIVSTFQDSDRFGFLSDFVWIVANPAECASLLVQRD